MTEELVFYETEENIATVTMNPPEKLNAISHELRSGVAEALLRADGDKSVSVVILRAEGRSFCVGYDIDTDSPEREERRYDAVKWHESLREDLHFEMIPWNMRKPVIASVQGHALGGGCELTMYCDITIAADNGLFGEPEIRFSIVGLDLLRSGNLPCRVRCRAGYRDGRRCAGSRSCFPTHRRAAPPNAVARENGSPSIPRHCPPYRGCRTARRRAKIRRPGRYADNRRRHRGRSTPRSRN